MTKIFFFYLLFSCVIGFSQTLYQKTVIEEAEKFSKKANKAYKKERYKEADSLYSLSLSISPNAEAYMTRAFSRWELGRYSDCCDDLTLAFKYGSLEAGSMFENNCVVANTFYLDSLMKKSNKDNYYYSLDFIKHKYKNQQEYFKKNKKNELIDGYKIKEKDTLFYYILSEQNMLREDIKNLGNYISQNLRYPQLEFDSKITGTVYVEIVINEMGKIVKTDILYTPSRGFETETKRVFMNAPNIQPMFRNNRFVKSVLHFPINFH